MSTQDLHDRRPLVFLAVLVSHAVIVILLIRTARQPVCSRSDSYEPPAPPQPKIDWEREAELAAQNAVAAAEKQGNYRDLSALSAAQLSWVRRNHLEPAPPGIAWTHPRVEIQKGGLPIIWINDHCIAVPVMMLMVFCKIGHIEANGGLFDHMRDPRNP